MLKDQLNQACSLALTEQKVVKDRNSASKTVLEVQKPESVRLQKVLSEVRKVEAIHTIPSETSSVFELPKVVVLKQSRKQRF